MSEGTGLHKPPSKSELMKSAKVVAAAVKSAMNKDTSDVDKAEVAGAAADLLAAAKQSGHGGGNNGNPEDQKFRRYLDKAEKYLHKYHTKNSKDAPHGGGGGGGGSGVGGGEGGGVHGNYKKKAKNFLRKRQMEPGQTHQRGGGGGKHEAESEDEIESDVSDVSLSEDSD